MFKKRQAIISFATFLTILVLLISCGELGDKTQVSPSGSVPNRSITPTSIIPSSTALPTTIANTTFLAVTKTTLKANITPNPTTLNCQPSPSQVVNKLLEVQGEAPGAEFWALLFLGEPLPMRANIPIKIVWKMTGSETEEINLVAQHSDGTKIQPFHGTTRHDSSDWKRAGAEWGSVFIFPKTGCWRVLATLGTFAGEMRFEVVN